MYTGGSAVNAIRYVTEDILDYMVESNRIILENFSDSCYLLHRLWSGGHVDPQSIVTYDDLNNLIFTVWVGNPGGTPNLNHPDLRYDTGPDQRGTFKVVKDGTELTRQRYITDLAYNTDFYVGSDSDGTVTVTLYSSGSNVTVEYDTLCYCVDPERSTARANCTTCYGTMYEGGFVLDSGSAGTWNASGTILVRIPPNFKDIVVESVRNLRVDESAEAWTLAPPIYPRIDDYDVIIPCTGDHSGSLFEVTTVRISHLRDRTLSQRFTIKNPEDKYILSQHPIFTG